jgi:hypothetical protein
MEAVRNYQPVPEKMKKVIGAKRRFFGPSLTLMIADAELPDNARPLPKYSRMTLNLNALEGVGHA